MTTDKRDVRQTKEQKRGGHESAHFLFDAHNAGSSDRNNDIHEASTTWPIMKCGNRERGYFLLDLN